MYLRPARPGALLEYLLTVFSCSTLTRQHLMLPKPKVGPRCSRATRR
jgi:hypothetical protein